MGFLAPHAPPLAPPVPGDPLSTSEVLERREAAAEPRSRFSRETLVHLAAILVGSVLILVAAFNQPYNENEYVQMNPYGADTIEEITSGTRQPPLDPLLGALFQRLFGIGQLQQRLVPVLAGIGILIVMSLLLRRLRTGGAGMFGVWLLATAPLLIRFSAYTRPYASPLFLMVLFSYAAHRWLEDRRPGWLVVAGVSAAALPATRVPEPNVFLVMAGLTVAFLTVRGVWSWRRSWPVVAIAAAAVAFVGYPMYASLADSASSLYDPSPSGIASRFRGGVEEMLTFFLPLLGDWIPWWPVSLAVLLAALAVPASRRRLFGWWMFWPLLAAPVAFVFAYHFVNTFSFDVRPYRPRFLMFFVPSYILVATALATVVAARETVGRRVRQGLAVLLAVALLGQLPATAKVLFENEAADFEEASEALLRLPEDAIVLYDSASPVGLWRQPFHGEDRYMGDRQPYIGYVANLVKRAKAVPEDGPVYILMLDSRCAYSVVCDIRPADWDTDIPGWRVREDLDKFDLYEPETPLEGREGTIEALTVLGKDLGPKYGHLATLSAAKLIKLEGRPEEARALIQEMYDEAGPALARRIFERIQDRNLDPFPRVPERPQAG